MIELVSRRIAEKNLERRATRCKPPLRAGCEADYTLAVEMLLFAGPIAGDLLGDYGQVAWTTFQVAANAIRRGWMNPCQALRFARDAIETAVAGAGRLEAEGLPLKHEPGDPPKNWDHDAEMEQEAAPC